MADLTSYLNSPTSVAGGVSPSPSKGAVASNFLGGLSDLITYRQNLSERRDNKDRQGVLDARADEAYSRQQRSDLAKDEFEGAIFAAQQQAVPKEVEQAAQNLSATQQAVAQGKAPSTAFSLKLEQIVSEMHAKFPDQRSEIGTYLQGRGFDHYLFRGLRADQAAVDLDDQIQRETVKAYAKAATDNGVYDPADPVGSQDRGRKILVASANLRAAKEAADAARADRTLSIQEKEAATKDADREGVKSIIDISTTKIGPLFDQFNSLVNAAGDDATKQRALTDAVPQLQVALKSFRQNVAPLAAGMGPDAAKELNSWLDQREKDITDVISGDLSSFKLNQQNLQSMQTQFGINASQALPLYAGLKSVFGTAGVTNLLGSDPTMSMKPEVRERLKKELNEYNPIAEPEEASVHLYNTARLLRGELNFQQLTPRQAREQLPNLVAVTAGIEKQIRDNGVTVDEANTYRNSYSNLLSAAVQLEPGTTPLKSVDQATALVTKSTSRRALEALIANPDTNEMGRALTKASRATSAKMLEIVRDVPVTSRRQQDGFMETTIEFDKNAGLYVIKQTARDKQEAQKNNEKLRAQAAGAYSGVVPRPSTTVDPNIQTKVNVLNANLVHLAETAKHDDSVPTTLTPLQLRQSYATGVVPVKKDENGKTAEQAFQESLNSFKDEVRGATSGIIKDPNLGARGNLPRGLRNNNPGNIEDGAFARSLPGYQGSDGRFAKFDTKENGVNATAELLSSYGKRGFDTAKEIINRWAPPSDNNPTSNYVQFVADAIGVKPDDKLDMSDPKIRTKVARAIHQFENGPNG